jgi:HlyD family secretion protein
VQDGTAHFQPVRVGIAGQSYFVVQSGLSLGDRVVSGPFRALSEIKDGEAVKVKTERKPGT